MDVLPLLFPNKKDLEGIQQIGYSEEEVVKNELILKREQEEYAAALEDDGIELQEDEEGEGEEGEGEGEEGEEGEGK